MDQLFDLTIRESSVKVIEKLMKKLGIPIPGYRRTFRLRVNLADNDSRLLLSGIDENGKSASIFKKLEVSDLGPNMVSFSGLDRSKVTFPQSAT